MLEFKLGCYSQREAGGGRLALHGGWRHCTAAGGAEKQSRQAGWREGKRDLNTISKNTRDPTVNQR